MRNSMNNLKRIFTRYILAVLCMIGIGVNTIANAAYELSDTPSAGSVQVNINGASYYFTPDPSDTAYQNTTSLKNTLVSSGPTDADFYIENGGVRTYYKLNNDLDTFVRTAGSGDAFSLANHQTYVLTSNLSQFDKDGQYSIYANLGEEGRIYANGRQLFYINNVRQPCLNSVHLIYITQQHHRLIQRAQLCVQFLVEIIAARSLVEQLVGP